MDITVVVRIERETIINIEFSASELYFLCLTLSPDIYSSLSGFLGKGMLFGRKSTERRSNISDTLEKLHIYLLYLFGLLVLAFEYARRLLQSLKPVRVGASLT